MSGRSASKPRQRPLLTLLLVCAGALLMFLKCFLLLRRGPGLPEQERVTR